MNKRLTALLLALALILSVGMVSALADEETQPAEENAAAAAETEHTEAVTEENVTEGEVVSAAKEDVPVIEVEEATANMILFKDLAELVRKNSPTYGALAAQIDYVEETKDYVNMVEKAIGRPFVYISVGPERDSIIRRTGSEVHKR